jgi:hypothetical protein
MVPSSAISVAANGECLTCGGFSLGKTTHLGSYEFITDYFGILSLSLRRGDSSAAFMEIGHNRTLPLRRTMIEDSAEEFLIASSWEGAPPSPLLGGVARGLRSLPSQTHHGRRILRPLRP